MVPGFQDFLLPVLKFMGDGKEHSRDEISERVPMEYFSFTPEEMKEKTKNGNKLYIVDPFLGSSLLWCGLVGEG